jgi:hypothetical protein
MLRPTSPPSSSRPFSFAPRPGSPPGSPQRGTGIRAQESARFTVAEEIQSRPSWCRDDSRRRGTLYRTRSRKELLSTEILMYWHTYSRTYV